MRLAGATVNAFTVTQIATYDSTNNLIGIVSTLDSTVSGVTGLSKLGHGDQQQAKSNASIESVTNKWAYN